MARAALSFDIRPDRFQQPPTLRFGLYDDDSHATMSGLSIRSDTARLGLHIAPGFYRTDQSFDLVGYSDNVATHWQ